MLCRCSSCTTPTLIAYDLTPALISPITAGYTLVTNSMHLRFQCLLLSKAIPLTIIQYIECNQAMTSSSSNTLRQCTSCLHLQEKEELRIMGYAVGLVYKSGWRSALQHRNNSTSISTHTTSKSICLIAVVSGSCKATSLDLQDTLNPIDATIRIATIANGKE